MHGRTEQQNVVLSQEIYVDIVNDGTTYTRNKQLEEISYHDAYFE